MRPAAHMGSVTGHPGAVVTGSADVLVNGKPAAAAGLHQVACAKHGGSVIASGRDDVLLNGRPMARLLDKVFCTGAPAALPPPSGGPDSIKVEGVTLSDEEKAQLMEAIKAGDQARIALILAKAMKGQAADGEGAVVKVTFVDPSPLDPNQYTEYELTVGEAKAHASPLGPQLPKVEEKDGVVRIRHAASVTGAQIKKTHVKRIVHDDGSATELRTSGSIGVGAGGGYDIAIGPGGVNIAVDTPAFGVGAEVRKIPAPVAMPAIDQIVANTSFDVFLGG